MNLARLSMASAVAALVALSFQTQTHAQFYQHPGWLYGPAVFSTPPQFFPNPGGPPDTYREETYWGRFMPGRDWGRQVGYNLSNHNGWEYDPITKQNVWVQGQRWRNPLTGQPHGDIYVTRQNPDGSLSTTRQKTSAKVGGGEGTQIPGQAVGR